MDGIREVARAYYERSKKEKHSAETFFNSLAADRNGKVKLPKFKKSVGNWLGEERIFRQLDKNGDGALDLDESLALYYMVKKVRILKCNKCNKLLVGPYFSCLPCLGKVPNTFDLCCACYREGKFKHQHQPNQFLDHHALLMLFRDCTTYAEKKRGQQEMEELREIANAHYQAAPQKVKDLADNFFKDMDTDRDGGVDLSEFLEFMSEKGYAEKQSRDLFKKLDSDGNNKLDFLEAMTFFYITKSGRPFCNSCENFIPGIYFSCIECFKSPKGSFNLCRDCYQPGKCDHNHNGKVQFLDNYTLLEVQKNEPPSNAVARRSKTTNIWAGALKAFELGLSIGSISTTLCTIL